MAAQMYGWDSVQPIGRASGKPSSNSFLGMTGSRTPSRATTLVRVAFGSNHRLRQTWPSRAKIWDGHELGQKQTALLQVVPGNSVCR